ncbi:MAG: sigma 54-interacting transcriptional regulator [Clostridiales Family XIII bacterium]|nr:sigma 54-interacting transcriptional regulator [Clostridiales Family XIII bacterium]
MKRTEPEPQVRERQRENFIIGADPEIKRITDTILRIAPFDATVLLMGESGVGKNLFAGMLHSFNKRKDFPFVTIDCGAIPENLLESELFGYEGGAFTGASRKGKAGLIETADRGTLFLDEISDLPLPLQAKLLKVIQEKKVTRVGGIQEKSVDFRLIAATNEDIPGLVERGDFRRDLFYRLNVISITIPPIRKRKGDIPRFIDHFAAKYNEKYGKNLVFSDGAVERMKRYPWPGNVRELENTVEGLILIADDSVVTEDMLPASMYAETAMEKYHGEGKTLKQILESVEKEILLEAYEELGATTKVAKALGISQASVSLKLNKYKNRPDER